MPYNPALDGVRAVAVLVVVAFHCGVPGMLGGMIGVDLFFVLSGLLITTILRNELEATGTISLRVFYWKRMLRLWPPLALFLVAYYFAGRILFAGIDVRADTAIAALYLSDYFMAIWQTPLEICHTWSLAVEEHFYIVWPVLLLATRRFSARHMVCGLSAGFVFATAWRIVDAFIWDDWYWTYYRFDTRMSGLILGSLLAVIKWRPSARDAAIAGRYSLYVLILATIMLRTGTMGSLLWGVIVADLAAAGLILSLVSGHYTPLARSLSHPVLRYLGLISYSIYLWHYPLARVLRDQFNPIVAFIVVAAAAIAIAALSYHLVERPLKIFRRRELLVS